MTTKEQLAELFNENYTIGDGNRYMSEETFIRIAPQIQLMLNSPQGDVEITDIRSTREYRKFCNEVIDTLDKFREKQIEQGATLRFIADSFIDAIKSYPSASAKEFDENDMKNAFGHGIIYDVEINKPSLVGFDEWLKQYRNSGGKNENT